jgi:predicted cobalt transporter CbtA
MEIRVIGRGALAGFIAGLLGFLFARIFAEPLIDEAMDYESGRGEILNKLNTAVGLAAEPEGPEIFRRHIQSTIGIATGIVGFATAMGALVAVAYLVLHGRFNVRPQALVWQIAGFGFIAVYLLPFIKYPANPPAVGHDFTIGDRGRLYLTLVAASMVLLIGAIVFARRLRPRFGLLGAVVLSGLGFFIVYGLVIGLMPSLGHLRANLDHANQFGFARSSTETPQPITNIMSQPISIDGQSFAPGQLVYPGFDADLLWKFRWYSIINQLIIWAGVALIFGALVERFITGGKSRSAGSAPAEPAAVR